MNDLFEKEYLKRLRADYRKVLEGDGGNCPCCARWGKINTFHLDETNALSLLWMKKNEVDADGWIHTAKVAPRWMMRAKSFSTMRHWGLVESAPNDDKEKKGAGVWRLTNKAHNFVGGKVRLPKKHLFITAPWLHTATKKFTSANVLASGLTMKKLCRIGLTLTKYKVNLETKRVHRCGGSVVP